MYVVDEHADLLREVAQDAALEGDVPLEDLAALIGVARQVHGMPDPAVSAQSFIEGKMKLRAALRENDRRGLLRLLPGLAFLRLRWPKVAAAAGVAGVTAAVVVAGAVASGVGMPAFLARGPLAVFEEGPHRSVAQVATAPADQPTVLPSPAASAEGAPTTGSGPDGGAPPANVPPSRPPMAVQTPDSSPGLGAGPGPTSTATSRAQQFYFEGVVLGASAGSITVLTNVGARTVAITSGTLIMQRGRQVAAGVLVVGVHVEVKASDDGNGGLVAGRIIVDDPASATTPAPSASVQAPSSTPPTATETPEVTETPEATETPEPTYTPKPSETPEPPHDHGNHGGGHGGGND